MAQENRSISILNKIRRVKYRYGIYKKFSKKITFENFTTDIKRVKAYTFMLDKPDKGCNNSKTILIVSHGFNMNGAPSAVFYLAQYLDRHGFNVIVASPTRGEIETELVKNKIPYFVFDGVIDTNLVTHYAELFDCVVCCTICTARIIKGLNKVHVNSKVIWWIHESSIYYTEHILNEMPSVLNNNIKVCCGGLIAQRELQKRRRYRTSMLLYPTDEIRLDNKYEENDGKVLFAVIGNKCRRKGQDILLDAIQYIDATMLTNIVFYVVGRNSYTNKTEKEAYQTSIAKYRNIIVEMPEVSREELYKIYRIMDCLIMPSREDPMPIVVTNALQLNKRVICSENVGTVEYFQENPGTYIYKNNDPQMLAKDIERAFISISQFETVNTRSIYERHLSESAFEESLMKVL